ncbi:hypothetical protein LXA43DRAFT_1093338 [Ganoderma leucocontextum]|nr:hypothetical protein LXA43DRAFT_1093338 [Ganoderma leucocontextum]
MSLETVPKDEFPLFHLLELVSTEPLTSDIILIPPIDQQTSCSIVRRLHTDDATILRTLKPEDVQGWCLSRIADYRSCIKALRAQPDSSMYNASFHESIVQLKSNMCALRSTYNDAAPIHRSLPPEILLEIFANFHHDGTRRGHAASRVCHYWHPLLQHTAPFWRSLLGQEFLGEWEPPWKADRFRVAFFKSAPLDLSLCLRGIHPATVDILSSHSRRISSVAIQVIEYSGQGEPLHRFLQLDMPILRELEVRHGCFASYRAFSHIARFKLSAFPHLRTLRLSSIYFEPAEASHTELRHLELKDCLGPVGSASHTDLDLQTILDTIRNCPNLETLRIAGWSPNTLSDLDAPVDVPRLRHIILRISSGSTRAFLSRLVLPLTTLLDLEPCFPYAHDLLPLPLSTSLVTPLDRPPVAEVAMHLKFGYHKNTATWKAQGAGSRPLRVSTFNCVDLHSPDATLTYTQQVVAIFAPGTAVTSLTIAGARRATKPYWTRLLAGLPHLARLAVDGGDARDDPMLFPLLAKPQEDGRCLCPMLADLSVFWDEDAPDVTTPSTTGTVDASYPSPAQIYEAGYPPLARTDEALFRQPYGPAETHAYCRVLELCLRGRAEHGCRPLKALSVSIWDCGEGQGLRDAGREGALTVEAMLREGLRDLVEEVSVKLQSRWEV